MRAASDQLVQRAARWPGLRLLVYLAEAFKFRVRHDHLPLRRVMADYTEWRRWQESPRHALTDGHPWITFAATRFLEARLQPDARVFEYGAGGSTLFFALRADRVYAVEHDPGWSDEVARAVEMLRLRNTTIALIQPAPDSHPTHLEPADPDGYLSSDPRFAGRTFHAYAAAIDGHADGAFHVVMLDGRARPSCFKHAVRKIAPGGILVLDNAERAHYRHIQTTLDDLGWFRHDLPGPGPYSRHFWKTTAWTRPEQ